MMNITQSRTSWTIQLQRGTSWLKNSITSKKCKPKSRGYSFIIQHIKTEEADQCIEHFDGIILCCKKQVVDTSTDLHKRIIIARPNDHYNTLKNL